MTTLFGNIDHFLVPLTILYLGLIMALSAEMEKYENQKESEEKEDVERADKQEEYKRFNTI